MAAEITITNEELESKINAAVAQATGGIRSELTEERKAKKELERKLAEKEKIETDETEKREKADLEAKGKYEEALAKTRAAHEKQVAELTDKLAKAEAQIRSHRVDEEILKHSGDAVDPNDALALFKAAYDFDLTDSSVTVKKRDGTPLLDDKGKPLGIDGAVSQFLASKPHLVKAGGAGGSGSRGGNTTVNRSEIETLKTQLSDMQKAGSVAPLDQRIALKNKIHQMEHAGAT